MVKDPPKGREREDTDESLRAERERTNTELARTRGLIDEGSDEVLQQTRERADDALATAREEADRKLVRAGAASSEMASIARERRDADVVRREERTTADAQLGDEREARKRALAELLRFEREQTDERLLIERARSDSSIVARDDFMGMVSHDLRTLLAGIALHAALQIRHAGTDPANARIVESAHKIQRFTARMVRLVGDLVDVASIEAGQLAIARARHDATLLVRESLEAFHPSAAAKGVTLTADLGGDTVLAEFDHERILQVLANLLGNAIKFTEEGGRVRLQVEPIGTEVRFSVSDTGPGIAVGQHEAIFDRFWQVERGDRRGLGLGLFISRCIVEAHGGRIWVESEPGVGSTFRFTLPGGPR